MSYSSTPATILIATPVPTTPLTIRQAPFAYPPSLKAHRADQATQLPLVVTLATELLLLFLIGIFLPFVIAYIVARA
ncbi:hypothetical protein AOQ84DRAFT_1253 [Glonium stellatum]|uniref:Uncharacterized protein n=1 Tax=Glonium stellatum TaxID=574774 RepID=A0A8E2JV27_9PEZI|nr:hypothetical protein AOQ84DRAFT_1253 [Glonium stellatum]